MDVEDDEDPWDRHAPEGYSNCVLQCFRGKTKARAIHEAVQIYGKGDYVAVPGHFHMGEHGDQPPVFRPFGWMVFERDQ